MTHWRRNRGFSGLATTAIKPLGSTRSGRPDPARLAARSLRTVRKCEPGKVLVAVAVEGLGRCRAGQHRQQRYATGPASLMAGTDAGAVVAVEILVEQDQVAPMRVGVERLGAAIERAPSVGPAPEDGEDSAGNLLGDLEQREQLAG